MNEVTLVSADVPVQQAQKQGFMSCCTSVAAFSKGHNTQLMCAWVKERQEEEGKF